MRVLSVACIAETSVRIKRVHIVAVVGSFGACPVFIVCFSLVGGISRIVEVVQFCTLLRHQAIYALPGVNTHLDRGKQKALSRKAIRAGGNIGRIVIRPLHVGQMHGHQAVCHTGCDISARVVDTPVVQSISFVTVDVTATDGSGRCNARPPEPCAVGRAVV